MKFQKVSRDANHVEIKQELIKAGYGVIDLAGVGNSVPDLLVCTITGMTVLIEVKMPKQQIYLHQIKFGCQWWGYYGFAETVEEAKDLLMFPESCCLDPIQKLVGLEIVEEWLAKSKATDPTKTKPKIRIMEFEDQLITRTAVWRSEMENGIRRCDGRLVSTNST